MNEKPEASPQSKTPLPLGQPTLGPEKGRGEAAGGLPGPVERGTPETDAARIVELTPMKTRRHTKNAHELAMDALRWEKCKPKNPGEYFTRHASDGKCITIVTVTKARRGLSVYCAAYNDRVSMSRIGDTELEWAERPNEKAQLPHPRAGE